MNRRSVIALAFGLCVLTSFGFAQKAERPFQQGQWIGQASVGLASGGLYGDVKVPPMNFVLEYATTDEWGVGFFGGYASSRNVLGTIFGEDYGFEYSYLILAGSVSYHFDADMKNVDAYGRAFLGYVFVSASDLGGQTIGSAGGSFAGYGSYIGATYYLAPGFGVQGEVGYGNMAILRFGVTLKF